MSEKEIVIPISKIKTREELDLADKIKREVSFDVTEMKDELDLNKPNMKVLNEGHIAVKFPKFIQLIATHEFEEIIEKHQSEDVIISSDLLVDLAGTTPIPEDSSESRFSLIFLGLVLGLVIGAIVFLFFLK